MSWSWMYIGYSCEFGSCLRVVWCWGFGLGSSFWWVGRFCGDVFVKGLLLEFNFFWGLVVRWDLFYGLSV